MSLNVNYTSLYQKGIDTSMLKEVSKEILTRAAQKSSYSSVNTASVNPSQLGIDLYNGKVDTNVQKQIAMNNAYQFQLNEKTIQSIQFLNSQAAITGRIDGKYAPAVNEVVTETQKVSDTNKSQYMSIFASEASKDREGSNPFYNGELLLGEKKKESANQNSQSGAESLKSIFA